MEKIRKFNLKTAITLGIIFYSLTILMHVLIITKVLPFLWVNGGRSESFSEQFPISMINIVIAIFGIVFTIFAGKVKSSKYAKVITIACWFFVIFWSFGFVLQLFGTPFEKMFCSIILLLGVVSNLRLAIEKR